MPRFHKISLDVEEVAVGAVMRHLHNMKGVVNVYYDMDQIAYKQIKKPNGQAPRQSYGISGADFVVQTLAKTGKPLLTSKIADAFEQAGRSRHSGNSVIHALKVQGLITATPEGYVLSKKAKDRLRRKEA